MERNGRKRKVSNRNTEAVCKTCLDLLFSILLLAILFALFMSRLYLQPLLNKILQLPTVWVIIIAVLSFLLLIVFCSCLVFLVKWLKRTKRLLRVVPLCILEIGLVLIILSYCKDICWEQILWNTTIFGTGVTTFALGIAFLALFHSRKSEAVAIDKVIKDSDSKMQELTTKIQMTDKVVKEVNNKIQQLNTKIKMIDKTTKDLDSKMQKLDTKIQTLIDKGWGKKN